MNKKKISVAMASYNSIKYIGEQLDSIRTQTLNEIIIRDDCLTDSMFEFCSDDINKTNLNASVILFFRAINMIFGGWLRFK